MQNPEMVNNLIDQMSNMELQTQLAFIAGNFKPISDAICHDTIMIPLQKFDDRMYLANKCCGPIRG